MDKKYILFDFDGVIVDSFQPAYEANKVVCPLLSEDGYRARFEGNINDWKTALDHTEHCRHDVDFFAEYSTRMHSVVVMPKMQEVVKDLANKYTLIVVSSSTTALIKELLLKNNLEQHFSKILGNDVHGSKVEKIKMVFNIYQTSANSCVFVTDTLGDLKEAAIMDVGAIAVSWGFHSSETLQKGIHYELVNDPHEIVGSVENYFQNN